MDVFDSTVNVIPAAYSNAGGQMEIDCEVAMDWELQKIDSLSKTAAIYVWWPSLSMKKPHMKKPHWKENNRHRKTSQNRKTN